MVQRPSLPPRLVRPFPARQWLIRQKTVPLPAAPQPAASPSAPASTKAGAPGKAAPAGAVPLPPLPPLSGRGAIPTLSEEALDLLLLVSCLPRGVRDGLASQVQALAAQRGRRRPPGGVAAILRVHLLLPGEQQDPVGWRRRRLAAEVASGLALLKTPLSQMSRPLRNRALVAHAEAIGQLAQELSQCPGALPLEQELAWALASLRR
jgi:hypothetical protein